MPLNYTGQPEEDLYGQINHYWNDPTKTSNLLNQFGQTFSANFQNQVGRAPTADEINSYFSNAVAPIMGTAQGFGGQDYNSVNQLAQSYIPTNFGKDIQQYQSDQATKQQQSLSQQEGNQLQQNISTLQGLTPQITQQVMDSFTKGPGLQSLEGSFNNSGLLNSGAFSQALGNTLGGQAAGMEANALTGLINPALQQIQGNPQQGYAGAQNAYSGFQNTGLQGQAGIGSTNQNLYDFNLQSQLAQKLAEDSAPSGFEKGLGYANAASGVVGNAGKAAGPLSSATSYICLELINRGLACKSDLDILHCHVMPAVWKKGRAFHLYTYRGKQLVEAANAAGIDWRPWRKRFLDDVIAEPDALKAVRLYLQAFHDLAMQVAPDLWDARALRESFLDSVPFFPRLAVCRPYLKALWTAVRMRCMFLLDLPLSPNRFETEKNHGA